MQGRLEFRILLRCPFAAQVAHQNPEIESSDMHEQAFENVLVFLKVRSTHPSRFEVVRKRSFKQLAAAAK